MEMQFPVILDGATGTELQKRGFTGDMSAEQWVLEHPESILEIQRKYVASGSNVLYAPTFGGNRQKLEERGIFNRTEEMNKALAQLSKQAADGKAWVAGDIAPTGRFLAPLGDASFEELVDIYTEQAAGLEQAGVDLYVIETMMTLTDARAAVLAIRSMSKKPILVSFTCDESGKILSGTDVAAALSVMEGMGVSAFGLNCSAGPEQMLPQLQRLHKYARVPLIAKPNAGMPEIVNGEAVYNCPPEEFVALVPEMLKAGVVLFGGCCGTTEEHIAALKAALKDAEYVRPAPESLDLLPAATEKEAFFLPADASFEELVDIYTEQAAGLEQAGVDLYVIETMMTLTDARAAVLAIRSMSKKPILVSFTCDESGKILSGTDVAAALSVMEGMGVSAFGLNCSAGPEQMLPQLQRLHKYARVPLIAKPNAGMPEIVNGEAVYNCPPEEFVALVPEMLKAGVVLFGGCCGTTEEHIAALKAALKDAEYVRPAPECLDLLPAATEKEAFFLPADATHGAVLTADSDLEDKLSDAMDDEWPMVALKLASWADVDALADYQYMIRKPLCLICDDAELLEAGLRAYQGRALYEGNLTEDALAPLVEKYGLLV